MSSLNVSTVRRRGFVGRWYFTLCEPYQFYFQVSWKFTLAGHRVFPANWHDMTAKYGEIGNALFPHFLSIYRYLLVKTPYHMTYEIRPSFPRTRLAPLFVRLRSLDPADVRWETSRNFARSHARNVTVRNAIISSSFIASFSRNRLHVANSLSQMETPESPDFATCNSPSTAYISQSSPASKPLWDVKFLPTNKATT